MKKLINLTMLICVLLSAVSVVAQTTFKVGEFTYTIIGDNHVGVTYTIVKQEKMSIFESNKLLKECGKMENAVIPQHVSYDGVQYDVVMIQPSAFNLCFNLKSVIIPKGITEIGEGAFFSCFKLKSVDIPSSVVKIGDKAFHKKTKIIKSTIDDPPSNNTIATKPAPPTKDTQYNQNFSFVVDGIEYKILDDNSVAVWSYNGTNVNLIIPSSIRGYNVTEISFSAFQNNTKLTSVIIPSSVLSIGVSAFSGCTNLKNVNIPFSVKEIGDECFCDCSNLREIIIPGSVKEIGGLLFNYCNRDLTIYCGGISSKPSGWSEKWNAVSKNNLDLYHHTEWNFMVALPFSFYAKEHIESEINEWQKKGEFEKTSDWQQRVNQETRQEKINELKQKAKEDYLRECTPNLKESLVLGQYDADNEVYLVNSSNFGQMLVPVPLSDAPSFKTQWANMTITPKYYIDNDIINVESITFTNPNNKKTYTYSNQASLNYTTAEIDFNFDPIDIQVESNGNNAAKDNQTISTSKISVGKSDIDLNIPETGMRNENTFVVIIANENYRKESKVPFAQNDGSVFAEYCRKTLGVNTKNVHFVADATLNDIKYEINWITKVMEAYNGEAKVIFYYAGHGIPDEKDKTAYLLPVDGYGSDVTTGIKLDDLYATFGSLPSKSVTFFLDACFSGANRNGEMLASARGVAIKVKGNAPSGNMVIFSAAQGDETAYPDTEHQHGMFTYYLLKKIRETKGDVTYKDLCDYTTENVRRSSIVTNGKSQTPKVTSSQTVGEKWKEWKLR